MIGKDKNGKLIFGYARIPGVNYLAPALSAHAPVIKSSNQINVEIQNFGQVDSPESMVRVYIRKDDRKVEIAGSKVTPLKPFEKVNLTLNSSESISGMTKYDFDVVINSGETDEVIMLGKELSPMPQKVLIQKNGEL